MSPVDAETLIRNRGTWATAIPTLVRDLRMSPDAAKNAINGLLRRQRLVRIRKPVNTRRAPALEGYALYVHRDALEPTP